MAFGYNYGNIRNISVDKLKQKVYYDNSNNEIC